MHLALAIGSLIAACCSLAYVLTSGRRIKRLHDETAANWAFAAELNAKTRQNWQQVAELNAKAAADRAAVADRH